MKTGVIVAATIQDATVGDPTTMLGTMSERNGSQTRDTTRTM